MNGEYSLHPYGEAALIAETDEVISEASYRRIRGLFEVLRANPPLGLRELIPAYSSLLVVYDPLAADYPAMEAAIHDLASRAEASDEGPQEIVRIPVCYESPYAMDLDEVARHAGLGPEEVVELHASRAYRVYMLGFTPGFPYLGGMTEKIAVPRRASPRIKIPAGSIGIADRQTGIYPQESPGGWNIIGRTPAVLFDPVRDPPALLRAGQFVRFFPIPADQFERIAEAAGRGDWKPDIVNKLGVER